MVPAMHPDFVEHKLVAILSADVAGYSRLMASDEVATVRELQAGREHIAVFVRQHRGRVVSTLRATTSSPSSRARSMRLAALGLPTADGGRVKASAPPWVRSSARGRRHSQLRTSASTPGTAIGCGLNPGSRPVDTTRP